MAHLTRYYMYKKIKESLGEKIEGKVLCISGIDNIRPLISDNANILDVQYPGVDMQNMPYDDNSFDFVISDQVIEHLEDPQKAVEESCRVLKEGGIVVLTSCFINYIHSGPIDLWRFSPEALKILCKGFSEILNCGGWGNRLAITLCFLSDKFRSMQIPDNKRNIRNFIATWNESRYPIVTWAVAKK